MSSNLTPTAMDSKTIFVVLSLAASIGTFVPYFLNMWKRTARPHIFSWITWGLLTGLGFILSFSQGGGGGAWVFGLQSVLCFVVVAYGFFYGEKNITRVDWIVFLSALTLVVFYVFTKNVVLSVVLAATIDLLGFIPTFRKSYLKPYEEPAFTYFSTFISFLLSLGALGTYSFVTMFYPIALIVINISLVSFLLIRRRALRSRET